MRSVLLKKTAFYGSLLSGVIAIDQITKFIVVSSLSAGESKTVIPGFLKITHVKNPGAAFGLFSGTSWLVYPFSIIMIVLTLVMLIIMRSELTNVSVLGLVLILGGALGNTIDRISRGRVIDFLDFGWWPVFNIADVAIVTGVIILIIWAFRRHFARESV